MADSVTPDIDRNLNALQTDNRPLADIFAAAEKPIGQLIDDEYNAARADMFSALKHAVSCGNHLLNAKVQAEQKKEEWLKWLGKNTNVPQRTASLYMQLASHQEAISKGLANDPQLSITKAIKLLPKAAQRGRPGGRGARPNNPTTPQSLATTIKEQSIAPDEIVDSSKQAGTDLVEMAKKIIDKITSDETVKELVKYIAAHREKLKK
jgi:hypothetical protein